MTKISKDPSKQQLINKFNNTFRYLDDILALNNDDFSMYTREIYPVELTLNEANINNDYCPFLDLDIYITNGKLNTKIYDKRDDFLFPFVNYPFLDGDVPLSPSYGVYISQLQYHKLVKTFTKFYHRYKDIIRKRGTKDTKGTVKLINLKQTDNAKAKNENEKQKKTNSTHETT